jgi:hypothetical protein
MTTTPSFMRSRWFMPLFSLFLGALVAGALALGGDTLGSVFCLALFAAVAALFYVGKRSETLQGLGGPGRDERWALIDLTATALAGTVVLLVLVGCWLYELASGRDGSRTPSCWRSAASPISPPWRCCASGAS